MKIRFTSGEHSGKIMEFSDTEITIGREDGNVVQLLTGGVSRYHAKIVRLEQGSWIITDLGSTNGVKIDGQLIQGERVLCAGDVITIGEQKFEIVELETFSRVSFQPVYEDKAASAVNEKPQIVPLTAPEVSGAAPSVPESSVKPKEDVLSGEKLLAELKSAGNTLFNAAQSRIKSEVKNEQLSEGQAERKKFKRMFNIVFYTCLAVCVVCAVMFFIQPKTPAKNTGGQSVVPSNAVVYFERVEYDPVKKSAFRVEVRIENGIMSCVLDDVAGMRHFKREIEISGNYENELGTLLHKLENSGIFKSKKDKEIPEETEKDRYHLVIVSGNEICDYRCSPNSASGAFQECNAALREFLFCFGLSTIAQNRRDIEDEARAHLNNAVEKKENYLKDLSYLRESAREFEAAISCYEQFTPAPPELKEAKKGLEHINNLRKQKLKEYQDEFERSRRRNDFSGMQSSCKAIMKIAGERSIAYREAANMLLRVRRLDSKRRK